MAPLELRLLWIRVREAFRILEARVRGPVVGEIGERLAREQHAVGVLRLDGPAEETILEYELRQLVALESIVACLLVLFVEGREENGLGEVDRPAAGPAAASPAAESADRRHIV